MLHTVLSQHANTKFSTAVMQAVGSKSESQAEAFVIMSRQYQHMVEDISSTFDAKQRAYFSRNLAIFAALEKFATYDSNVQTLKQNILHEHQLEKLLGLDLALIGRCERPLLEYTNEAKAALAESRKLLLELNLPDHVNEVIAQRISQLEQVVNNFDFFGVSGLQKSFEELLGAVELYPSPVIKTSKKFKGFQAMIMASVIAIATGVKATNSTVKDGMELIEQVSSVKGYIEDLRDNVLDNKSDGEE